MASGALPDWSPAHRPELITARTLSSGPAAVPQRCPCPSCGWPRLLLMSARLAGLHLRPPEAGRPVFSRRVKHCPSVPSNRVLLLTWRTLEDFVSEAVGGVPVGRSWSWKYCFIYTYRVIKNFSHTWPHLNLVTPRWQRGGLYYHHHFQVKGESGRVQISQSVKRSKNCSQLGRLSIYLLCNHVMCDSMEWWLADSA